jgi:hypothetical protein
MLHRQLAAKHYPQPHAENQRRPRSAAEAGDRARAL